MNSDVLLMALKYAGGFIAASYGLYATLTDFRVEKDGKKVLSRKGYLGIALLITSSILALSTDAFKDYREHQTKLRESEEKVKTAEAETKRVEEARANEQRILEQLGIQLQASQETSSDLKLALTTLATNTKTTQGISANLGTQLAVTTGVSRQLGGAVNSLNRTARATNVVLEETLDRIDSVIVYVEILVDPLAFKDSSGRSILSEASLKLLEMDKKGEIDLEYDEEKQKTIVRELEAQQTVIRSTIFSNWSIAIALNKDDDGDSTTKSLDFPEMITAHLGENGLAGFMIGFTEKTSKFGVGRSGYKGVTCFATYSIAPNRYAGIRRFSDLNGVEWRIALKANENILELTGGSLTVGGIFPMLEMPQENIKKEGEGYIAIMTVPENYFKRVSNGSNK